MQKVSLVGATGYTGHEILKLLLRHPEVEIVSLSAKVEETIWIEEEYPDLRGLINMECGELDVEKVASLSDLVFLALPHRVSKLFAGPFLRKGLRVIDLSADYRFRDPALYESRYGDAHGDLDTLSEAVYGLPELCREEIRTARLVANPGCYPTAAILATAPLLREGLVETGKIVVDAKSGVTGAGRKASLPLLFAECNESVRAYRVGIHPHEAEMEDQLKVVAGGPVKVLFAPHLVPVNRGILCAVYLTPKGAVFAGDLHALYEDFYGRAPFVRVLPSGLYPDTKHVAGSNYCDVAVHPVGESDMIVALSAIDNLVKGAAGQAVQNMNLMCGFEETLGLL